MIDLEVEMLSGEPTRWCGLEYERSRLLRFRQVRSHFYVFKILVRFVVVSMRGGHMRHPPPPSSSSSGFGQPFRVKAKQWWPCAKVLTAYLSLEAWSLILCTGFVSVLIKVSLLVEVHAWRSLRLCGRSCFRFSSVHVKFELSERRYRLVAYRRPLRLLSICLTASRISFKVVLIRCSTLIVSPVIGVLEVCKRLVLGTPTWTKASV